MTSWAKVGAKCVCTRDSNTGSWGSGGELQNGRVYTVRWSGWFTNPKTKQEYFGVRLVEAPRKERSGNLLLGLVDCPFIADRFRPLISKTQSEDVAMFLELLQKQGEPA